MPSAPLYNSLSTAPVPCDPCRTGVVVHFVCGRALEEERARTRAKAPEDRKITCSKHPELRFATWEELEVHAASSPEHRLPALPAVKDSAPGPVARGGLPAPKPAAAPDRAARAGGWRYVRCASCGQRRARNPRGKWFDAVRPAVDPRYRPRHHHRWLPVTEPLTITYDGAPQRERMLDGVDDGR